MLSVATELQTNVIVTNIKHSRFKILGAQCDYTGPVAVVAIQNNGTGCLRSHFERLVPCTNVRCHLGDVVESHESKRPLASCCSTWTALWPHIGSTPMTDDDAYMWRRFTNLAIGGQSLHVVKYANERWRVEWRKLPVFVQIDEPSKQIQWLRRTWQHHGIHMLQLVRAHWQRSRSIKQVYG